MDELLLARWTWRSYSQDGHTPTWRSYSQPDGHESAIPGKMDMDELLQARLTHPDMDELLPAR